jgi:hypothetical protein
VNIEDSGNGERTDFGEEESGDGLLSASADALFSLPASASLPNAVADTGCSEVFIMTKATITAAAAPSATRLRFFVKNLLKRLALNLYLFLLFFIKTLA